MKRSYYAVMLTVFFSLTISATAFADSSDDDARKHLVRGMAAIEMAKNNEELAAAAIEFKKATEIAPNMAAAWYNLGSVQVKIGQISQAIDSYRKYLTLAPKAEDARRINDEIIKLEYRLEREKLATMLAGTWSTANGQKFKLVLDRARLQLTREQGEDILTIKSMGTHIGAMTDVPLVFSGTLIGDTITGQYLQAAGTYSGFCDLPERKGNFEGTVDVQKGQMRIVYNRVTLEYEMKFKSLLSDELVCRQTKRQESPGYVLELKRDPLSPAQTGK
jgi:tetratricopeptide (TPR) repeat protein